MRCISRRAQEVLRYMLDEENRGNFEDAEIVCDGRSCFVGIEDPDPVSKATVNELLRCVLIRTASEPGAMERYGLNEDGRKAALDPTWLPPEMLGRERASDPTVQERK